MLKSIRNSIVLTSIAYIVLGLVLVIFPDNSLRAACMLIGAITLIYGVVRVASYFRGDGAYAKRFDLFAGVLLVIVGVFLLMSPQFFVSLIPVALGVYILVDCFTAVKKALDMKALGYSKWWVSFLVALLLAVCGVVMIFDPFGAMSTLTVFIGVGFIFDGVYTLVNTLVADHVFKK